MIPMRREIERLLKQADRDVENARKNLGIEAYEVAAFLAQQAVEKYLKGVWGAANAVPYELYDHTTARTKVQNAEAVIAWLRSRIPS